MYFSFIHVLIFIRNIEENSDDEKVNQTEDVVSEDSGWSIYFTYLMDNCT